jgi:uncharacterized protein YbbC (DUF1343 family)
VIQTGLDVLIGEGLPELAGKRLGLITNHTGVDRALRSGIDHLYASDRFTLAALFGPEHGVRGQAQAGEQVSSTIDRRTGLPVHSLYGDTHKPTPDMLAGIETLVYDIQDVPVRYATYASTLAAAQEACAELGLSFVVCDRPNPLTGRYVEGNVLDPAFRSFVGVHPIAIRHGLTTGELATLFAADNGWPEPIVIPMRGWQRRLWFDQTGLPWVLPSPNLPALESLLAYPGTCLIEGTNLSEGRGTTGPFELTGAPWLDPDALADELNARHLPGVAFRPHSFVPTFSKHAGTPCAGVQLHILDRDAFRPVATGIHLLHACRLLSGDRFEWRAAAPEAGGHHGLFIDLLAGTDRLRLDLEAWAQPDEIVARWEEDAAAFAERTKEFWRYKV